MGNIEDRHLKQGIGTSLAARSEPVISTASQARAVDDVTWITVQAVTSVSTACAKPTQRTL